MKQIDRERKLTQRFLKCHLSKLVNNPGQEQIDPELLCGPISAIPRAFTDSNGLPYKSAKHTATAYLERRYSSISVVLHTLPSNWIPDSVILEGMFMIQTYPLSHMETMDSYAKLLLQKYVCPHLFAGATEVHIVFDNPSSQTESPKEIEQFRRDQTATTENHDCAVFQSSSKTPRDWKSTLGCRQCKNNLIVYVASEMIRLSPPYLKGTQAVITNIGTHALRVSANSTTPTQNHTLSSNANEADLRVWLHCQCSYGTKKLIFSPDTDVYHIGLTIARVIPSCDIMIQLNKSTMEDQKYIHLNGLLQALDTDPDLATTNCATRPQILQSLYVSTGCDYISYFQGIGKISFLATFFNMSTLLLGTPIFLGL